MDGDSFVKIPPGTRENLATREIHFSPNSCTAVEDRFGKVKVPIMEHFCRGYRLLVD